MTGRDIEKSICREMSGDLEQGMLAVGRCLGPARLPTRDWCVLWALWGLVMLRLRGSAMKKAQDLGLPKPACLSAGSLTASWVTMELYPQLSWRYLVSISIATLGREL